jgi:hypothetical protein
VSTVLSAIAALSGQNPAALAGASGTLLALDASVSLGTLDA